MAAKIISGTQIAAEIREEIKTGNGCSQGEIRCRSRARYDSGRSEPGIGQLRDGKG